ncbi:MAG TPA: VOC family protein [Thermoanaerobaculia bacterium]|nr:VOC family protein [Thermoanaerobaculia bacterium]
MTPPDAKGSNDSTFALSKLGQIAINVGDLERATAFYRDSLGMRFLFSAPGMAFFDCGGVRLLLGTPEKPEDDHPSSILYFTVPDVREAHQALSARGVELEGEPHLVHRTDSYELWMAFFHDSEGNLLALMSEEIPG